MVKSEKKDGKEAIGGNTMNTNPISRKRQIKDTDMEIDDEALKLKISKHEGCMGRNPINHHENHHLELLGLRNPQAILSLHILVRQQYINKGI